ncbi:hypothetical protein Prudu_013603 [Prunus dulcis]|uniref:Transposable element protein n=1 Tax=Prunus dulcis TaxID=3755 RepID=A0A4Y1RFP8_PRUDU|nr:hypothetical protein Prudu_013603 [Prunus dulcis]
MNILRYLKSTFDHGLVYKPSPLSLIVYADAYYAGDPDDRCFTRGYCIYLGDNHVSWSSKKQQGVSRSNNETEYRQLAYTDAACPGCACYFMISIFPSLFHSRTCHIEVDYHYVREKVIRKEVKVGYISSKDQLVDLLTKGFSTFRFRYYLLSKLPVLCHPLNLWRRDKPNPDLTVSN